MIDENKINIAVVVVVVVVVDNDAFALNVFKEASFFLKTEHSWTLFDH